MRHRWLIVSMLLFVSFLPAYSQSNKPVVGITRLHPRSSPVIIHKGEEKKFWVNISNLISRKKLAPIFIARNPVLKIRYPSSALSVQVDSRSGFSVSKSASTITVRITERVGYERLNSLQPGAGGKIYYSVKALKPGDHSLILETDCSNCVRNLTQRYTIRVPGPPAVTKRQTPPAVVKKQAPPRVIKKPVSKPHTREKPVPSYKSPPKKQKPHRSRSTPKRKKDEGMPDWLFLLIGLGTMYVIGLIGQQLSRLLKNLRKKKAATRRVFAPVQQDIQKPKVNLNLDSPGKKKPQVKLNLDSEGLDIPDQKKPGVTLNLAKKPEKEEKKADRKVTGIETTVIPAALPPDGKSSAVVTARVFNLEGGGIPGKEVSFKISPPAFQACLSRTSGLTDAYGRLNVDFTIPQDTRGRDEVHISGFTTDHLGNRIQSAALMKIQHPKPGNLTILVRSERNREKVIAGATIVIRGMQRGIRITKKTGPDGSVCFDHLPSGNYRIEIEKKHYKNYTHESVAVSGGEDTLHKADLTGSRQHVNKLLTAESRLHSEVVQLLASDKDSYIQTLAWEIAGFVMSIYGDITGTSSKPDLPGIPDTGDLLDEFQSHQAAAGLKAYEYLAGEIWDVISCNLPVPAPGEGFTKADVRSVVVSLSTRNESALMEQAVKMAYSESFPWEQYKKLIAVEGVQSLGSELDASGYAKALVYMGCLLSFARHYFRPRLQSIEDHHSELKEYWSDRDDPELFEVFPTEERFTQFHRMITKQGEFLRNHSARLKTYKLNKSKAAEILKMGKKFFDDVLGGEDMYQSGLIRLGVRTINNLPLSIQGYNYFVATSSAWGVLGLIPAAGPMDKAFRTVVDMGFKFGAFACLGLGMSALEKDMTRFAEILSDIVIASQNGVMAEQLVTDYGDFSF